MSFNKIIIYGHLGRDPEMRYTGQNIPVCSFSVATSERKKGQGGEEGKEETTWFKITLWRNLAETASKYLKKGSPVYIEGRLAAREWVDREGVTRTSLEVTATEMHLMGSRGEGGYSGGGESQSRAAASGGGSAGPVESNPVTDDDIPF